MASPASLAARAAAECSGGRKPTVTRTPKYLKPRSGDRNRQMPDDYVAAARLNEFKMRDASTD